MIYERRVVDVVYMDSCKKAFDKVFQDRPIQKIKIHGIHSGHLDSELTQNTMEGCYSGWQSVTSGVPQRSMLEPLLCEIRCPP